MRILLTATTLGESNEKDTTDHNSDAHKQTLCASTAPTTGKD
jgi:hypothetical protein